MRSFFLSFLFVLTSCQNPLTHETVGHGDEFELALGEQVQIGRERISVKFIDVLEDSRCPVNVRCIWAGNGKVQVQLAQNNIQLNTYLEPQEVMVEELTIQLLDLNPYPEYPLQFEKNDYKISLKITKK